MPCSFASNSIAPAIAFAVSSPDEYLAVFFSRDEGVVVQNFRAVDVSVVLVRDTCSLDAK